MADITSTIRFIADASQAIGTMRALAGEAQALNQSVARIQGQLIAQQTGSSNFTSNRGTLASQIVAGGPGANQLFNLPATTAIDQFNKTLRTTHEAIVLNSDGIEIFRSKLSNTSGDLREIESAVTRYGAASESAAIHLGALNNELQTQQGAIGTQLSAGRARVNSIIQEKNALKDLLATQIDTRLKLPNPKPTTFKSSAEDLATARARHQAIAQAEQDIRDTETAIRDASTRQGVASRSLTQFEKNDPIIQAAKARIQILKNLIPETEAASRTLLNSAQTAIDTAVKRPPPLPTALETVRQESPNLFNRLTKQGVLGSPGVVDVQKIYESGADQLQITRDLERGTSSLRGSVRGLNGELTNINASWAEGGRVIGRYGGALSGVQNFFRQTVNNLQKVVQWGLATTAVFAGLGLATSAISTIRNLDASLNQLSITAQLSATQTGAVFDDLAKIAYDTSTPLEQMVKAADDIALATKRANQSTVEWQDNIKSLATSVGILTNITGLDTVKATDLLTSTMKQLNLEADDLPNILNKVAAVAGGQANSITDVVSGLGAMAEAAQQANLSIDQTIGVVQVLGQVTSKSSSEIATSFKNLVGSVDSVGGKKALEKYNISLRDSQGELRNILDIYGEISDKIKQGVIPESDVKGLVKAIAGGPRRAPDAAALLANVDAIKEATQRAGEATNEALVANAKYLDTIESKITQIQVKFDTFVQKAFGPALKGFVNDVADVLGNLLSFLSTLNPEVIKSLLGLAALAISIKAITGTLKFFAGGFNDILQGIRIFNAAAAVGTDAFKLTGTTAALASTEVVNASRAEIASLDALIAAHSEAAAAAKLQGNAEVAAAEETSLAAALNRRSAAVTAESAATSAVATGASRSSLIGKGVGGALLGAGIGASLAAGTGGSAGQTIGGGLLGGGLSLLLSPLPIPHLKLLAGAMIAVGGALTFLTGESKKAEQSQADLSQQVLTSINQYKEAQTSVADLTKTHSDQRTQYEALLKSYKNGEVGIGTLNNKVLEYAQTTYDLKTANEALKQSFDDLSKSGSQLDTNFGKQIEAAQAGTLNPDAIKSLQKKIYEQLFGQIYPDLDAASKSSVPFTVLAPTKAQGSTQATVDVADQKVVHATKGAAGIDVIPAHVDTFDLANLKDASDILKLFNADASLITGHFELTAENIDLINTALSSTVKQGGDLGTKAEAAQKTFGLIISQFDSLSQANLFLKQQDALVQTRVILGQISAEDAKQAQSSLKVYKQIFEIAAGLPSAANVRENNRLPGGGTTGIGTSEAAQAAARRLLIDDEGNVKTGKVSIKDARELIELLGLTKDLKEGIKLSDQQVASISSNILGINTEITSEIERQAQASAELAEIQQNLEDERGKALDTLAEKSADIQKRYLSGDITKKLRDSLLLGAQATNHLDNRIINLLTNLSENLPILDQFEEKMATIPGLENLVGKNADQAATILVKYFDSMELTGKGANKLRDRIFNLIKALLAIPPEILINIKIATQYTNRADFISTEGNSPDDRDAANKAFSSATASAKSQYENYLKQLQQLQKQIAAIAGGSSGDTFLGSTSKSGSGGGSKSAGPGLDVSNLDLPDEIANADNRTSLIQEAIKRARALQHLIPGADKEAKNDVVELLKGTQRILEVRGIKDDLLRKALEELADIEKKKLEFETKADTIRRIRVGAGDFAALANVPLNTKTGVSVGSPDGPISINLNINGQILTPAQFAALADQIAAAIKRQLGA